MAVRCCERPRTAAQGLALLRTASHSSARPCVVVRSPRTTAHRPCVVVRSPRTTAHRPCVIVRSPRTTVHRPCVVVRSPRTTANGLASLCEALAQRRTASCRCTRPSRNARLSAGDSPPDWALRGQPSPVVWERVGHGEIPRSPHGRNVTWIRFWWPSLWQPTQPAVPATCRCTAR